MYTDDANCQHINLASDVCNFETIELGKMIKQGLLHNIPNIHRLTIDKAIENPIHNNKKKLK